MSKYLIILLILSNLFSQIKFDHGFGIEIADKEDYNIRELVEVNNSYGYGKAHVTFGNITTFYQLRISFKNFEVILDERIYNDRIGLVLAPRMGVFDSELRYTFKELYSIGIAHRCIHPIFTYDSRADLIYGGYNIKLKLHYNMK